MIALDPMTAPQTVALPGGEFLMGSTPAEVERCVDRWAARLVSPAFTAAAFRTWIEKESPAHLVSLRPFSIAKYPVTNAEYAAFCRAAGAAVPESVSSGLPGDHPVWGVTPAGADAYAAWLSAATGRAFRLPTEAEWEYAARGAERLEYPYGAEFDPARANTVESGVGATTPVDRYERFASPWGVCDLAGNVEEWVSGLYTPYPGGRFVEDDLTRALGANYPVLRGGSFARGGDLSRGARRHGPYPAPEYRFTGFRVVHPAIQEALP